MFTSGELRDLAKSIRGEVSEVATVVQGVVSRVDPAGTVWVLIGDNADPTPCAMDMACRPGDVVTVRIANHKATVIGNETAPATDDKAATVAHEAADIANTNAGAAQQTADVADQKAVSAMLAAKEAEDYAEDAHAAADSAQASAAAASGYATNALAGLATVQKVAETVMWIAEHGHMIATTDTQIDPAKAYFVEDEDGEYTADGVRYSLVEAPKVEDIGTYYELSVEESVQNYLTTILAVTSDGLHIFGENPRIIIGDTAGFHIEIDPTQMSFCFGPSAVAYVSYNELNIPRAVIADGLQVGQYRWTQLNNKNFALKYLEEEQNG